MNDGHPSSIERLAERGPHAVGLTTLEIPDPENTTRCLPTDVWYPASGGDGPEADHPFGRPHLAQPGLEPATGACPVVLFSHGNSGLRRQSTFLTTHLASWGVVVVAPDHIGNTFPEMQEITSEEERIRIHREARHNRPRDLDAALDTLLEADGDWPDIDASRVGALGHSFGGWTAFKMPARGRVRAVCGLAPASEAFVGRKAFEAGELPFRGDLPALIVAGFDDVLVDLETSVRPLFQRMTGPSALVGIEGADHFHFCDGIELLHGMHQGNPRENLPRPVRPYADQLNEERTHRSLRGVVTRFFLSTLAADEAALTACPSEAELQKLDSAIRRVEPA